MISEKPGRNGACELFLLSMASLFVELLVIRWMSADVRAFTVFRTFPLVTCFVGLGAGFAIGHDRIFKFTPFAALLFTLTMFMCDASGISFWGFPSIHNYQWQGLLPAPASILPLVSFMLTLFLLLAGPFAMCLCIGSRLGVLFNRQSPLHAYGMNLAGAIAGSMVFAALSYSGLEPWFLLAAICLLILFFVIRNHNLSWGPVAAVALMFLAGIFPGRQTSWVSTIQTDFSKEPTRTYWSPYQRLDVSVFRTGVMQYSETDGLELATNRAFYQYCFLDVDAGHYPPASARLIADRGKHYELPFGMVQPRDVLVVGAGLGQDVIYALKCGAQTVDAVEIDPVIVRLGKRFNAAYASLKVNLICDDARHFLGANKKKYDLIIFSLLDSHTVVGQGSSVRLDAYVYTVESITQAMSALKPGGVLVASFFAAVPWIPDRLYGTMKTAAGYAPMVLTDKESKSWRGNMCFVLGDRVRDGTQITPAGWEIATLGETSRILTDDWPFLYVKTGGVDVLYMLVVAQILMISIFAVRRHLFAGPDASLWQMFFLGAAFLLLELHAISFLSLIYGSTWLTSAIVINGILIMILIANMLVIKIGHLFIKRQPMLYLALLSLILMSYLLPPEIILRGSVETYGRVLLTALTLLPMCVAGIIFAAAFSTATNAARSLAFNLFGAVIGGLLEYLSVFYGIKSLELIAAVLYLFSFACLIRNRAKVPEHV